MTEAITLERLKKDIGWDNITEASETRGGQTLTVYTIHPDNPSLPGITIYGGPGGLFELCVGKDGAHFHLGKGTEQAVQLARELVAKEKSVLVTYFDNGVLDSWKLVDAAGWPDTFLKHDLLPSDAPDAPLTDLEGKKWATPRYTRLVFNQEPTEATPDFSGYIAVQCGWMTPDRRDELWTALEAAGQLDGNILL